MRVQRKPFRYFRVCHVRSPKDTYPEVALEGVREEEEHKAAAAEEEMTTASRQESEGKSSPPAEAAVLSDNASERPDTSSEAQTTESDEVVVQSSGLQESLGPPSDRIRVEVISLSLHPDSPPIADENIQQLYVSIGLPWPAAGGNRDLPFSLRKPQGNQEIYFHFSKVRMRKETVILGKEKLITLIKVDPDPESLQRQLLFSMLEAEEPQHNWLQFAVVSEPLPGTGGECEDVGFAYLDLREILLTGSDMLERELDVISPFDPDANIGKLKVSMEAASALRAIYWAGKRKSSEE
uniref:X-linked retinitis pigmentosa GTPase regulator-interacting protein 1-like n=1 Tax=Podarcis muralis TaxID=64176 RepID=UPI00109F0673|nr:X-linked retinitis pigmentosa GTPase regulator-interacting protein 1-like [Podarcis muralis]